MLQETSIGSRSPATSTTWCHSRLPLILFNNLASESVVMDCEIVGSSPRRGPRPRRFEAEETIEQKRRRIANRKRELAGLPPLRKPGEPLERSPCGRAVRRQGRQKPKTAPLPELTAYDSRRMWSLVNRRGPDDCWPWLAAQSNSGYGRFKLAGKLYSPHRLIYAQAYGPIEDVQEHHGSVVMQSCDNPICCNPAHLSLGRQVANVADMIAKGRRRGGSAPRSLARTQEG